MLLTADRFIHRSVIILLLMDTTRRSFEGIDFLVIDFDDNLGALQDSLIDDSSKTTVGYNFLNYNVESLEVKLLRVLKYC